MASIGIHSGNFLHPSFLPTNKSNHFFSPTPFVSIISNNTKKIPQQIVSASITSSNQGIVSPHQDKLTSDSHSEKDGDFLGKIDSWMHGSVADIVKNLKRAPLLVQIYAEDDGINENGRIKIHTEEADVEKWPLVKENWRSGAPDGLIFVEELERDFDQENENYQDFGEGLTRAWGIVVQGKGVECGPACYLLKTNKVCSGLGLGFCTHFCLMRVNNFRDSAFEQFKDSWLLR